MNKIKNEGITADFRFLLEDDDEEVFDFRTATDEEIMDWMNANLPKSFPEDRKKTILEKINGIKEQKK
ncbi:MAG: hypothetical protein HYV90_05300 [Candidatus Woesebacteria bacterium]|nr:MAG: hypothetical protein HYV90_05300 [Candidatus Woesebacteria bacterium]